MLNRLRSVLNRFSDYLFVGEAVLVGIFFIQALRYMLGTLYAHIASASLYPALDPDLINPEIAGLIEPSQVNTELTVIALMVLLPLVSLLLGRFSPLIAVAAVITAAGRYLMIGADDLIPTAVAVGGGLLYVAMIARHRARALPYMFVFGLAIDQYLRAVGDTMDPSLFDLKRVIMEVPSSDSKFTFESLIITLSIALVITSVMTVFSQMTRRQTGGDQSGVDQDHGLMPFWGGVGFGGLLFLQLALLSLPNAILGRARLGYDDYIWVAPVLVAATVLPVLPVVRAQARSFITMFDSAVRGWSWMLFIMLLLVLGTRLGGMVGGIALVITQFVASLLWWWLVRPKAAKERSFTGFWIVLGMLLFMLLYVMDIFTYEYAYVRDFATELEFLNPYIPPLLRGFRGMGIAVMLLAVFFAVLPMAQTRRRIAWRGGSAFATLLSFLFFVVGGAGLTYDVVRPPVVSAGSVAEGIRVGTYNIHSGYNEYFGFELPAIATTIAGSGSNIVMLQEVEAGRLTSFGIDQALWLARNLRMDARFYPTNEGLQGLVVLSNIPIVFDDGVLLDSIGTQTGLQRVQIVAGQTAITLYNTWLDPLLDIGDERTVEEVEDNQNKQLDQIFGIVQEHHPDGVFGNMIIGGTFNNVPDSDVMQRLSRNGLTDYFSGQPLELYATFWRTGQRARLDYLWATPSVVVDGYGVMPSNASDHRMVVIKLNLQ